MNKLMSACFYICTAFFVLFVLFFFFLIGSSIYGTVAGVTELTVTVTSADRVDDHWMVLGTDAQGDAVSLVNKDSPLHRKFDSSDLQAVIQPGETYRFRVCGRRIPFLSQYQNILEILPPESSP